MCIYVDIEFDKIRLIYVHILYEKFTSTLLSALLVFNIEVTIQYG